MASFSARLAVASPIALLLLSAATSVKAAPVPSGGHPRLFMSPPLLEAYKKNAPTPRSAAATLIAGCKEAIDKPNNFKTRGGADGDFWPGSAVNCAFAYRVTGDAQYLTAAIKYWHAALDDDQNIGDKLGCVSGVPVNWQAWQGNGPAPPVILTVTHDTGYGIRWYGPDVALTYDWLFDAPGVDEGLRAQTRTCLGAWTDWYSKSGYLHAEPGGNYNAGFVIAKAFAGIAIGNDGGADGHIWNETATVMDTLFTKNALANQSAPFPAKPGGLVGGDWPEGWQYGPLSILELAVTARALEEHGVPLPEMDAWANSLAVRLVHATTPTLDGNFTGHGDYDDEDIHAKLNRNTVDAIIAGPSSDQAAGWAAFMKDAYKATGGGFVYNAVAEARTVAAQDYRTQTPAPGLWYLARGTRHVYARTSWDDKALWGVFASYPGIVADHQHFAASQFVLSRGADHLIVDASRIGEGYSAESNAIYADSPTIESDRFTRSQTDFSEAELPWARGTSDAVYAARADITRAFLFRNKTDIKYGHREWAMLPEGEVVTIDRMHVAGAAQNMYVRFHTNTGGGGKLALANGVATGTVGGSQVAIHTVKLSGGTPSIAQPKVADCTASCAPCGECENARFAVDRYQVTLPGPFATAIHVIDALAAGEAPAITGSINDDSFDPAPKQNAGVIGAAVFRANKQTYVIASAAEDGVSPATMTYGVPTKGPSRHIVYDAPEDPATGKSLVTAVAQGERCVLSITAGAGFNGRPLLFTLSTAAEGCKLTEATDVAPGAAPPGGGVGLGDANPPNIVPPSAEDDDGCGCSTPKNPSGNLIVAGVAAAALAIARRRRRK